MFKKKLNIWHLVVGAGVCLVFDAFSGSNIIFLSIVCTGGVALIFWVPVFLLVGVVALTIFKILLGKHFITEKPQVALSPDEEAIRDYIKNARKEKMSVFDIKKNLVSNGWDEKEVEQQISKVIDNK